MNGREARIMTHKKTATSESMKKLAELMVSSLNNKQNRISGTPGTVLTFDDSGKLTELNRSALKGDPGTDGVSVVSVEQIATSSADDGINTFRITLSNGKTTDFSVKNGSKGSSGAAAGFGTPTATIDNNVGTPSVTVTTSGSNTQKVFNFAFKNLKGAKGDPGVNATTTATATASAAGLMSAADKAKLDGIEAGANKVTEMSDATIESIFNSVFN